MYGWVGVGDINKDGYPDIAVPHYVANSTASSLSNVVTVFMNRWGDRNETERTQFGAFEDTVNNGSNNGGRFDIITGAYYTFAMEIADFILSLSEDKDLIQRLDLFSWDSDE